MWYKCIEALTRPERKRFMQVLFVINLLGSVYGYYWYRMQLDANPITTWLIIPDSPRSTTFFAVALLIMLAGKRSPWFQALAYTGVIKYGTWAVVIIIQAWAMGDPKNFTDWMLLVSHSGMALQGILFLVPLKLTAPAAVIAAGWMFFNDFMDYFYMYHPYLYRDDQLFVALAAAVLLSVSLSVTLWIKRAGAGGKI